MNEENVQKILKYVVEEPKEEDDEIRKYKYKDF